MPVNPPSWRNDTVLPLPNEVVANAWAVDAACSGNPGPMEYQCIDLQTGAQVFHYGPIHGTNNIGEFLAIVHALALMQQKGITDKIIYSDSVNAQLWVSKKQCKTKLERTPQTEQLYQVIARAENWLRTHPINIPIIKWETKKWGEIPADFATKGKKPLPSPPAARHPRGLAACCGVMSFFYPSTHSSPLGMPINTGDSGLLVKSEEYLTGSLYENKIKEFSITVPVKQPTSDKCASRLFAVFQLAIYILPVSYFRFLHQSSQILASIIASTCINTRYFARNGVKIPFRAEFT